MRKKVAQDDWKNTPKNELCFRSTSQKSQETKGLDRRHRPGQAQLWCGGEPCSPPVRGGLAVGWLQHS